MSPTQTTTNRSAAAKKTAASRSAAAKRRSATAQKAAATRQLNQRNPLEQAQDVAEKAVLIPVGAALLARDRVVERVVDVAKPYRSRETAQRRIERDIKRFERRGTTARNRVERELKRTRTRVERELRQRRTRVERVVKRNRTRVEREAKSLQHDVRRQTKVAQTRVDEAVASGQKVAADVQERVATIA